MEITEVKVFPIGEEKLKAFVSVVFDHCFMVNDIKVIQGKEGLFISMPSRKKKSGEFKDVAHPLNNATRKMIETKVLDEYDRILIERGYGPSAPARQLADDPEQSFQDDSRPLPQAETAKLSRPVAQPVGAGADGAEDADGSLEEVEELHLKDSFWTV